MSSIRQEIPPAGGAKPHYRGDLSKTSLPEILYTIERFEVPGVVEVRRGDVLKKIFLREGRVVHAASSDLEDSLGAFLRSTGRLSEQGFDATMRERRNTNERYGVLLVEGGYLSPAEVSRAIREHVEAIVWSLFYWNEGKATFRIGDVGRLDSVRLQLPVGRVILEGIKRAPKAKALVSRLGRRETVYESCFQAETLIEIGLERDEYQLLKLVDGRRTLYDLCSQGPMSPAENGKVLHAFHVMQLIRARRADGEEADRSEEAEVVEEPELEVGKEADTGGIKKVRFKTPGDKFSV